MKRDLPAGQEIDFLIETGLFGRKPWPNQEQAPFMVVPYALRQYSSRRLMDKPWKPRLFSTNDQAAATLREHLKSYGELTIHYANWTWTVLVKRQTGEEVSASAETLPLALARCALRFVVKK